MDLPGFTSIKRDIPRYTRIHLALPGSTWGNIDLLGYTQIYLNRDLNLPQFTWINMNLRGFTWIYLDIPGLTQTDLD